MFHFDMLREENLIVLEEAKTANSQNTFLLEVASPAFTIEIEKQAKHKQRLKKL